MVVKNEKKKHIMIEMGTLGFVTPIGTIIGIVLTLHHGEDVAGEVFLESSSYIKVYKILR